MLIHADKIKIEQVIGNLLSNASKYSPPESPVHFLLSDLGTSIEVRIKDFGIGIPAEKLPLVFERYFRVEETSKNYSGLGLGLIYRKSHHRRAMGGK